MPSYSPTATYAATATPAKKAGHRTITVTVDGEAIYSRTTKAPYTVVLLQGWDGEPTDRVALRFSTTAKPVGSRHAGGTVVAVIPITDAPQTPTATATTAPAEPEQARLRFRVTLRDPHGSITRIETTAPDAETVKRREERAGYYTVVAVTDITSADPYAGLS